MPEPDPELDALRARWLQLIRHDLPRAASARPDWPIRLDHCFARVILDHVCGRPWREVLSAPAYKHLSVEQLRQGLELGRSLIENQTDLGELNRRSLQSRGKRLARYASTTA
jgi:hypothetical protein